MTNSAVNKQSEPGNAPEEKHESLDECPEVVMLVDGTISVLFNRNVPKQLVKLKNGHHKNKTEITLKSFTLHSLKHLPPQ